MPTRELDAILTSAEAAELHREASVAREYLVWFVLVDDPAFPGRHVARAHTADQRGGVWLPGLLVADTLEALVG